MTSPRRIVPQSYPVRYGTVYGSVYGPYGTSRTPVKLSWRPTRASASEAFNFSIASPRRCQYGSDPDQYTVPYTDLYTVRIYGSVASPRSWTMSPERDSHASTYQTRISLRIRIYGSVYGSVWVLGVTTSTSEITSDRAVEQYPCNSSCQTYVTRTRIRSRIRIRI